MRIRKGIPTLTRRKLTTRANDDRHLEESLGMEVKEKVFKKNELSEWEWNKSKSVEG